MSSDNLILCGFMGAGKSTLAPILATMLKYRCVDTDRVIEDTEQMSIAEIFNRYGEKAFREKETLILKDVLSKRKQVVSLGGGVLLSEKNRDIIETSGLLLCLHASLETLEKRLQRTDRPLLKGKPKGFFAKLYAQRASLYENVSWTYTTDDRMVEDCAQDIFNQWKEKSLC